MAVAGIEGRKKIDGLFKMSTGAVLLALGIESGPLALVLIPSGLVIALFGLRDLGIKSDAQ